MATFRAVLQPDPTGTGTFVVVPRKVNEELGLKGRPKIEAVIAGHPYRGSLAPVGDGTFALGVLKAIQQSAGVKRGDTVTVVLELDTAPRVVDLPADLARALARDKKMAAAWDRLSFTNKKEMAGSIEEARRPETRERRLAAAIAKLRIGGARKAESDHPHAPLAQKVRNPAGATGLRSGSRPAGRR